MLTGNVELSSICSSPHQHPLPSLRHHSRAQGYQFGKPGLRLLVLRAHSLLNGLLALRHDIGIDRCLETVKDLTFNCRVSIGSVSAGEGSLCSSLGRMADIHRRRERAVTPLERLRLLSRDVQLRSGRGGQFLPVEKRDRRVMGAVRLPGEPGVLLDLMVELVVITKNVIVGLWAAIGGDNIRFRLAGCAWLSAGREEPRKRAKHVLSLCDQTLITGARWRHTLVSVARYRDSSAVTGNGQEAQASGQNRPVRPA